MDKVKEQCASFVLVVVNMGYFSHSSQQFPLLKCIGLGIALGVTASTISLGLLTMQQNDRKELRARYYGDVPFGYNIKYDQNAGIMGSTLKHLNERQRESIV